MLVVSNTEAAETLVHLASKLDEQQFQQLQVRLSGRLGSPGSMGVGCQPHTTKTWRFAPPNREQPPIACQAQPLQQLGETIQARLHVLLCCSLQVLLDSCGHEELSDYLRLVTGQQHAHSRASKGAAAKLNSSVTAARSGQAPAAGLTSSAWLELLLGLYY